ncbi:hypothetical protein CISIN_1g035131mg [Citrus sinensis]|uniref:Uncharacterized protein n=1 Tax=Citrus sinensis TaxID=2711 RepID=A0A067FFR1_CITSI|nr:hypothetical protein CISIN_1g035131mg [Citrus sinensis]
MIIALKTSCITTSFIVSPCLCKISIEHALCKISIENNFSILLLLLNSRFMSEQQCICIIKIHFTNSDKRSYI